MLCSRRFPQPYLPENPLILETSRKPKHEVAIKTRCIGATQTKQSCWWSLASDMSQLLNQRWCQSVWGLQWSVITGVSGARGTFACMTGRHTRCHTSKATLLLALWFMINFFTLLSAGFWLVILGAFKIHNSPARGSHYLHFDSFPHTAVWSRNIYFETMQPAYKKSAVTNSFFLTFSTTMDYVLSLRSCVLFLRPGLSWSSSRSLITTEQKVSCSAASFRCLCSNGHKYSYEENSSEPIWQLWRI